MGHTCEDCGETFATLSRLRLHDCPGPDPEDERFLERISEELQGDLEKGAILSSVPDEPLSMDVVERFEEAETIHTTVPLFGSFDKPNAAERLAVQMVDGGCILEFFPRNGWVVVRTVEGEGRSVDEIEADLMAQADDWMSVVTELSMASAKGEQGVPARLERELGWR